jgi:hypothetical protein
VRLSPEQFANSGPSPTTEDAFTTVSHLADGVGWNLKHGTSHTLSMMRAVEGAEIPAKQKKVILWHANHAAKHMLEAKEHAERLSKHVARHPAFREATDEIRRIDPMRYGAAG